MEVKLSSKEVLQQIKELRARGESLSKKKIKKENLQLMRSALHYFPDWEHAVERSKAE
jgi:hypothetical protein